MNVLIRPLTPEDLQCVAGIERQAFPTLWPPTPFKRDMNHRQAKYLVAWEPKLDQDGQVRAPESEELAKPPAASLFGRLVGGVRDRLAPDKVPSKTDHSILGFVGLWFMAGEAHITAIAVEEASRGKGIGELLLIGSIELAMSRQAKLVSLEVRVSNYVAQSLYEKYGFQKMGIRKAYYTDNREDAAIMTTQPINTPAYQETYHTLLAAYRQRHGETNIELS